MQVQLLVKSNSEPTPRDYIFQMKKRVVLGRSPESAVPLEGTAISREHLVLELDGERIYATDLSNNGTWVNGNRLKREERVQLSSGDSVELPDYQISFRIPLEGETTNSPHAPNQTGTVSVVVPSEPLASRPSTVSHQPEKLTPSEKTGLASPTLLEMWMLLLALLTLGLIAYYMFLT